MLYIYTHIYMYRSFRMIPASEKEGEYVQGRGIPWTFLVTEDDKEPSSG